MAFAVIGNKPKREAEMRIYDPRFKYTPSLSTNILSTWKRFGFKPTTDAEREARQRRTYNPAEPEESREPSASITKLDMTKRKVRA
jgi:hypothetical protein